MKEHAKRLIGPRATVRPRSLIQGHERPRWGNLRRTVPFSLEELTRAELDAHDPRYPVLTTIVCRPQ
jgi:hypothetical protein